MVLSIGQLVSALMETAASQLMTLKLKIVANILCTTCQDNALVMCNQDTVPVLLVGDVQNSQCKLYK